MLRYIEAPRSFVRAAMPAPVIFLAGGITDCPNWQSDVVLALREEHPGGLGVRGTILNPRRANFPMKDPTAAEEQIMWEYQALRAADIVVFWFCRETIQPIVLLEFGAALERAGGFGAGRMQRLVIGAAEGYPRMQDVQIQSLCALGHDREILPTLERVIARLQTEIGRFREAQRP